MSITPAGLRQGLMMTIVAGGAATAGALGTNAVLGERPDGRGVGLTSLAGGLAMIGGMGASSIFPDIGAKGTVAALGVATLGLGVVFGGLMSVSPDI